MSVSALRQCAGVLNSGAIIYFSRHQISFELESPALSKTGVSMSKQSFLYQNTLACISWTALIVCIYYLNRCTPPLADDWCYHCMEWCNVLPDTWREYFNWNPRITGTLLTRVFALSPNWLVDIILTVFAVIMYVSIVYISAGVEWRRVMLCWYTPLLLWGMNLFLMLAPGQVLFWHCGAAFYLVPMSCGTALAASFIKSLRESSVWNPTGMKMAIFYVLALVSGMGTFNYIGAVFLLGCVLLWRGYMRLQYHHSEFIKSWWKLILVLSLIILCQFLIVIAPGNACRLACFPPEEVGNIFNGGFERQTRDTINTIFNFHVFRVLWVYMIIGTGLILRHFLTPWSRVDTYIVYGFIVLFFISLGSLYLSPVRMAERVYAPSLVFLMIAAFRILYPLFEVRWKLVRWGMSAVVVAWMALMLPAKLAAWEQKVWWDRAENMLLSDCRDIVLPYCPLANNYVCGHPLFIYEIDSDKLDGKNPVSRVFGKHTVTESNVRCSYKTAKDDVFIFRDNLVLSGDAPSVMGGTLCLQSEEKDDFPELIIWYPSPSVSTWLAPSAVWKRMTIDNSRQADAETLRAMGYVSAVMVRGQIEWSPYPKSLKKPKVPTIWIQVSPDTDVYECCIGKPDWR